MGRSPALLPNLSGMSSQRWLRFWASVAVALAFADASIVVLALPQIVDRLHTSISHVVYVIAAYNAALIAGALGVMFVGRRLGYLTALVTGLLVFGVASLGSAAAGSLGVLVGFRLLQGAGGALLLCGSLPFLTAASHSEQSPLGRWAAAAAIGAALGPAAGGLLTQVFDWRAIFLAQAPVAALGALAAWSARREPSPQAIDLGTASGDPAPARPGWLTVGPATANVALALISAGLIGALFLVTVLLINVWQLTPLSAAFVLLAIPLATTVAERFSRGRSAVAFGAAGAASLAIGLALLGRVSHRQIGLAVIGLVLCGIGLGLGFPSLTATALRGGGHPLARVARTIAARDAGLVIGLLVLTPVFVDRLKVAQGQAVPSVTKAVLTAPLPVNSKLQLGAGLLAANAKAPQSQLPDFNPAFATVARTATPEAGQTLTLLQGRVHSEIVSAATGSFRRPLLLCSGFALLVFPLLGAVLLVRRRDQLMRR